MVSFNSDDGSSTSDGEGLMDLDTMFPEPERPPPPPPTIHTYASPLLAQFLSDEEAKLVVQLVGTNPLWGHVLWNAGVSLSDYFLTLATQRQPQEPGIAGATVLELGAGGGLPSLVCGVLGAAKVVVTDYPDEDLLDNLRWNVAENGRRLAPLADARRMWDERMVVKGHLWGKKTDELLDLVDGTPPSPPLLTDDVSPPPQPIPLERADERRKYDILILSDLIFNHSQHHSLLHSCEALITRRTGRAYVFHSHHLPQWYLRDLQFFRLAEQRGWRIRRVVREHRGVMFAEDQGDVEKRSTVWGWEMRWDGEAIGGSWDREEHSEGLTQVMQQAAGAGVE
ncbi:hypothetical protein QFC19_003540 [Naganishia cerealis]|uniref:Uncharacterized protein n=1 Tax=Naganishia cerealis TaxID=610337 RepID=A0ACC2W2E1_9TREE|nr:hypothetical protein QFC19_003540 [Naganishia cerealis]